MQRQHWVSLIGGLGLALLDRWVKLSVLNGTDLQWGILRVHLVENFGSVFSIPIPSPILFFGIAGALVWVVWVASKHWVSHPHQSSAAMLMLIGALSNIVDRWRYGFVIDWVDFGKWFPIVNGADILIVIGVTWYLGATQLTSKHQS